MNKHRPNWLALRLLIIALLAGLFIVHQQVAVLWVRELLQAGVVVIGFGLVGLWLHANASALEAEEARRKKERGINSV